MAIHEGRRKNGTKKGSRFLSGEKLPYTSTRMNARKKVKVRKLDTGLRLRMSDDRRKEKGGSGTMNY